MRLLKMLVLIFVGGVFISCGPVYMTDITNQYFYQLMVGDVYVTVKNLQFGAVKNDSNSDEINYYFVRPLPGVGGSEIVQKGHMPAGTKIKIKKILQGDIMLETLTIYVAEILSEGPGRGKEVRIKGKVYKKALFDGREKVTLDINYFNNI